MVSQFQLPPRYFNPSGYKSAEHLTSKAMTTLRKIVHEETKTGLIWSAVCAVGWTVASVVIGTSVFGTGLVEQMAIVTVLSLVSGIVISVSFIVVRLVTGADLSELRVGGSMFRPFVGAILSAFLVFYFVLLLELSLLFIPLAGVVVIVIIRKTSL